VAVGTALFGVLLIGLAIVLGKDASVGVLAIASLGAITAALVASLILAWCWAHRAGAGRTPGE